MTTYARPLVARTIIQNLVHQIDVTTDELTAYATETDAETDNLRAATPNGSLIVPEAHAHRDLVEAFAELARARTHLVNAHDEIGGALPSHVTQRFPR